MNEAFEIKPGTSAEVLKQAEAIRDAYVAEIAKYPNLKVLARLVNPGEWAKINIQVHSTDEVDGDRFHDVLNLGVDSTWHGDKVRFLKMTRHASQGGRGSKRTYKTMDRAKLRKIAKDASELEKLHVASAKASKASQSISGQWQKVRRQALKGVALHPCLEVSVWEKTEAPTQADIENLRFAVDFGRYASSRLSNYKLTLEQAVKIANLIAEVTGLDKSFAIVARTKDGETLQWDGNWFQRALRPNAPTQAKIYPTYADAQVELARLSEKHNAGEGAVLEIVPFSTLN